MKLTTRERILLHLLDNSDRADRFTVPTSVTQRGIAEACWFHARHAAEYLRPLVRDGLVRERKAHVQGARQRQRAYELTSGGRSAAVRLRSALEGEPVRIRTAGVVRETTLRDAIEELKASRRVLALVRDVVRRGTIDGETGGRSGGASRVAMVTDAPQLEGFLGRTRELDAIIGEGNGPRLIVVLGLPGIGKTWLGARSCEILRETRNLFWHRVQPWDSVSSLLADVGLFLSVLNRPGVSASLARGSPDQAAAALREDLDGTHAFLVFDDAHEAGRTAIPFFRLLKEAVLKAPDVRALVLTRHAIPFYDRRDVAVAGSIVELELGGLRTQDVAAGRSRKAQEVAAIGRRVGGHPLFFDLARRQAKTSLALVSFRRFLEEQVYGTLNGDERKMMKLASLYRVAVPRESLFWGESLDYDVLLSLIDRSLIRRIGDDRFAVHDTIRDFFAELSSPAERRELGAFGAMQLRVLAERSLARGNAVAARAALSNALDMSREDQVQIPLLEALGVATARIGDQPAALAAFRKAIEKAEDPETRARMHRRIAEVQEESGEIDAALLELDTALLELGDATTEEHGWAHLLRSSAARDAEDLEAARTNGLEALRVFRILGVASGEGRALLELGYVEYVSPDGTATVAEKHLRAALALAERLGDPAFLAKVHIALANVLAYEGRPEAGLEHLAAIQAMPVARSDPYVRKSYFEMKGLVSMLVDARRAKAALRKSLALAKEMRDRTTEATSDFGFGWVAFYQGQTASARAHVDAAARICIEQGMAGHAVEILFYSALCSLVDGDVEAFRKVLARLEEADLARGRESRYPRIWALRGIGRLLAGNAEEARAAFSVALKSDRMQWACITSLLYGAVLGAMGVRQDGRQYIEHAFDLAQEYGWTLPLNGMRAIQEKLSDVLRDAVPSAATSSP